MSSPVENPAPAAIMPPLRPVGPTPAPPVASAPSPWPDETYRGWSGL